jgi:hypothetical protein
MTSFLLPLYAITGAQIGVAAGLPIVGVLFLAVVAPTAGRWYVDVSSGVPPKQFIRGEWFVTTPLATGMIWLLCDALGLGTWVCVGIAFGIGYTFRVTALYRRGRSRSRQNQPASIATTTVARCSAANSRANPSASCATSGCSSNTPTTGPATRAKQRPRRPPVVRDGQGDRRRPAVRGHPPFVSSSAPVGTNRRTLPSHASSVTFSKC